MIGAFGAALLARGISLHSISSRTILQSLLAGYGADLASDPELEGVGISVEWWSSSSHSDEGPAPCAGLSGADGVGRSCRLGVYSVLRHRVPQSHAASWKQPGDNAIEQRRDGRGRRWA